MSDALKVAFVLVNANFPINDSLRNNLELIDEVKQVSRTLGPYDFVVKVGASNIENLREAITWKIRKLSDIKSTLTLVKNQ